MDESFTLGKSGATLENSVGPDVVLAKGLVTVYADLTRQNRLGSHAGNQGWGVNFGMKALF